MPFDRDRISAKQLEHISASSGACSLEDVSHSFRRHPYPPHVHKEAVLVDRWIVSKLSDKPFEATRSPSPFGWIMGSKYPKFGVRSPSEEIKWFHSWEIGSPAPDSQIAR